MNDTVLLHMLYIVECVVEKQLRNNRLIIIFWNNVLFRQQFEKFHAFYDYALLYFVTLTHKSYRDFFTPNFHYTVGIWLRKNLKPITTEKNVNQYHIGDPRWSFFQYIEILSRNNIAGVENKMSFYIKDFWLLIAGWKFYKLVL